MSLLATSFGINVEYAPRTLLAVVVFVDFVAVFVFVVGGGGVVGVVGGGGIAAAVVVILVVDDLTLTHRHNLVCGRK